jgi:hypothetical protein
MSDMNHRDRAVSEQIGYVLNLSVLFVFLALTAPIFSQLIGVSAAAQSQQAQTEAQRVADGLQSVDRLVRSSASPDTIGRHYELAPRIGNNKYTISVNWEPDGPGTIVIETDSLNVRVEAMFNSSTPVANQSVAGGQVYIVRKQGDTKITLESEGR